jgi:hypothetical protein
MTLGFSPDLEPPRDAFTRLDAFGWIAWRLCAERPNVYLKGDFMAPSCCPASW